LGGVVAGFGSANMSLLTELRLRVLAGFITVIPDCRGHPSTFAR
jgi:hypothetical protein